MIKKLFNGEINSITMAALLVGGSSLVSRLLGIFRDRILAGQFGAGDTLDVYYAAFRLPDLIFNLLVLGALSAGFIPIFTSLIKSPLLKLRSLLGHEYKEAWQLANNVLNILVLGLLLLCGLGVIFAPQIIQLIRLFLTGIRSKIGSPGHKQLLHCVPAAVSQSTHAECCIMRPLIFIKNNFIFVSQRPLLI